MVLNRIVILLIFILSTFGATLLKGHDLKEANNLFKSEKYKEALDIYKNIESTGKVGSGLYTNMASCYLALDNPLQSLIYAEKGLKYSPGNTDLKKFRDNLLKNYFKADVRIDHSKFTSLWEAFTSMLMPFYWIFLAFVPLIILAWKGYRYYPNNLKEKDFTIKASVLIILFLVLTYIGFSRFNSIYNNNSGIIISDKALLKAGPDDRSPVLDTLPAGTIIYYTDQIENWQNIRTDFGEAGWINVSESKKI